MMQKQDRAACKTLHRRSLASLPLRWEPLHLNNLDTEARVSKRIAEVLGSWEDTPYHHSMARKGKGVYCTAFVSQVLDELFRKTEPTPLNKIPHDVSMHCGHSARKGLKWFLRHFPTADRIWSATCDDDNHCDLGVQPGDILITGPIGGGPGHAIFIGPRKNVMWQASGNYVHYTGLALPVGSILYAVYRFSDKESWL